MKIFITPEEIVKLCLWDSFAYYIVGSEKEAEAILIENKEFEISENDALVIGLLKVIHTDNLIHKFNQHMTDILTNKSARIDNQVYIRKNALFAAFEDYYKKFPEYWKPDLRYKKALDALLEYMAQFKAEVEEMGVFSVDVEGGVTVEYYPSRAVKKLLKFQY